MKKLFVFVLALVLAVSLVACGKGESNNGAKISETNGDDYYFKAKVVEVNGTTLLVEVTEVGRAGLSVGSLVSFSRDAEFEVGDTVKVVFDGVIQETYPCQLPNVYSVTKIN